MLEITHVMKNFREFSLKDIDFSLPKGYICGLMGRNGAGKTTLLKLVSGLYRPDAGEIRIGGERLEGGEKACLEKLGVVFNEPVFPKYITPKQCGDVFGSRYKGYDAGLFAEGCRRFGVPWDVRVGKLSKGEGLKLQFAFALSHHPRLLLLDEPTGNFDPDFRREFLRIATEFVSGGEHSIVLATHILEDLEQIADYIVYLEKGRAVFAGERTRLEDSYRLVQGENYKLRLLNKERVIGAEYGEGTGKALVRHKPRYVYDSQVEVSAPSLADWMYFMEKADGGDGKRAGG